MKMRTMKLETVACLLEQHKGTEPKLLRTIQELSARPLPRARSAWLN